LLQVEREEYDIAAEEKGDEVKDCTKDNDSDVMFISNYNVYTCYIPSVFMQLFYCTDRVHFPICQKMLFLSTYLKQPLLNDKSQRSSGSGFT